MEKSSAEIAAAEEASRKRVADREKETGDQAGREAPTCVLAEEEKHICATHGGKSQNSLSESSNKEGEDTEADTMDTTGKRAACGFDCGFINSNKVCFLFNHSVTLLQF